MSTPERTKIRWEDEEEEKFPEELIKDILKGEEEEEEEDKPSWFLEPLEECMEVPPFGVTLIVGVTELGKTSLVKGLIQRNLKRNTGIRYMFFMESRGQEIMSTYPGKHIKRSQRRQSRPS